MRFSLIIATINRTEELSNMLLSLSNQNFESFEVIIIDQNYDERLNPVINNFKASLNIIYKKSISPGASKSRNYGITLAKGDIITFPDDDCEYPDELLFDISNLFYDNPHIDCFTGRIEDKNGDESVASFDNEKGLVDKNNVFSKSIEASIFVRKSSLEGVFFEEEIGVGSGTIWGSSEGPDFLLKLLANDKRIYYEPTIKIYHPSPISVITPKVIERAYKYNCGLGYVLKKHKYSYLYLCKRLIRVLGGMIIFFLKGNFSRSKFYKCSFVGIIIGYLKA